MHNIQEQQFDKARAAFFGLAMGDALGMPSQTLSMETINKVYGTIDDFIAPMPDHPVSKGLKAGSITDDTEQCILLAQEIIKNPQKIDAVSWAKRLIAWEKSIKERGLYDLLGPSSKAALKAILDGKNIDEAGKYGLTNGAPMRICPIAIATPIDQISVFVDHIEEASKITHNNAIAISAASAVAAIISASIEGIAFKDAVHKAMEAAAEGAKRGHQTQECYVIKAIKKAIATAVTLDDSPEGIKQFASIIGTSVDSHESIPAAFGILYLAKFNPWRAIQIAANIGDDTDTIGAIAGAMGAASKGMSSLPEKKMKILTLANKSHFEAANIDQMIVSLLNIRQDRKILSKQRIKADV